MVAKIASYVQSCLKCFMVYLLSYCWQEKVAQLLLYSIRLSNRSCFLLGYQYTPLIKVPKPTPSILCCNTQVNTIKQLLYYSRLQNSWEIIPCRETFLRLFFRPHHYGNLGGKSFGHIALILVVPGFVLDNSNKPVGTANFTEIQQFCNGLYQETWYALLRDARSLTWCVKLHVTFEGSHAEKQWPP